MAIGSKKKRYVYTDDSEKNWSVLIAQDRVEGVTPSTGLVAFDPASPPDDYQGRLNPKRCRRVYAEQTEPEEGAQPIKRQFICTIGSALYATTLSQTISYSPDGGADITLRSTVRRGEKITF